MILNCCQRTQTCPRLVLNKKKQYLESADLFLKALKDHELFKILNIYTLLPKILQLICKMNLPYSFHYQKEFQIIKYLKYNWIRQKIFYLMYKNSQTQNVRLNILINPKSQQLILSLDNQEKIYFLYQIRQRIITK